MQVFKKRLSKSTRVGVVLVGLTIFIILGLLVLDILHAGPVTRFLTNREAIQETVEGAGIWGWLIYIVLYVAQAIFAPIPGAVLGFIGGYIFGWVGIILSMIGMSIGMLSIFVLARRFGRPLVEKVITKEALGRFDFLTKKGSLVFFLIFLIPGLPDDAVGYVAGLTKIPIRKLLFLAIVGRLPAIVGTNLIGSGLGAGNIAPVVIISVVVLAILAILYAKKDAVMKFLEKA